MVDTVRSKTDLLANIPVGVAGGCSAQDIRDIIESLAAPFGGFYFSATTPTTVTDAGTYYKAAGTTTATNLRRFTMPVDNRLVYTGAPDTHCHIALSLDFTNSGTSDIIGLSLAKNGVEIFGSRQKTLVGTGSDIQAVAAHWDSMMSTNDYLEVFLTNESAAGQTVTIENGYLFAMGMLM